MSETPIEWTDVTWNPVRGCARVSPGCENCYAERVAHRFSGKGGKFEGLTVLGKKGPRWVGEARFVSHKLGDPLTWRKPRKVFVNSMSDLFHENVSNEEIAAVFGVMAACPQHTFQILTKRPARALAWFRWMTQMQGANERTGARVTLPVDPLVSAEICASRHVHLKPRSVGNGHHSPAWPLPNVWLGVSCEDQQRADERIPLILQCPAAVHFVSAEPLLGPIQFGAAAMWGGLDWVIVGGESGYGARPCAVEWIRSIAEQCTSAGVACFVKQLGAKPTENGLSLREYVDGEQRWHLSDRKGGKLEELPADLRLRQFPEAA